MYCVVDIESSGGPFGKEAMIEIAAFRYDGDEIVDQLISLVHPHREVQPFVSKMTGITPKMLVRAPRFHEIAKRLLEITEDAIIVGHNVEFDYRILRQEYARLGYQFERKTLDTIKLAEELMPGMKSYGLDSMCEELGLSRPHKHRAESDARATVELFEILREKDQRKGINSLEQSIHAGEYLRDKINDLLRSIKHNRGIYYLHDREGSLLYIGASDNVKSAVNRLFLGDSKRIQKLSEAVHGLKVEAVGNWLIARMKREEELLKVKAPFNGPLNTQLLYGIYADQRETPPSLSIQKLADAGRKKPWVQAPNLKAAQRALRMYQRFALGKRGDEVREVLAQFPERALFKAKGRNTSEQAVFVVEGGELKGYLYFKLNDKFKSWDRVHHVMTNLHDDPSYLQLLKLGILAGDFRLMDVPSLVEEPKS